MATTVESLAQDALKLTLDERRALIEQLLVSLETAQALHPAWHVEISRRLAAQRDGASTEWTADEAMARLAQHIHARRPAA